MKVKVSRFDAADYLTTPEDCAYFLTDALETKDPAQIAQALGVLARAKGMSEVAKKTGLNREGLYKILSDKGNPEIATILRVLQVLGVELVAQPAKAKRKTAASRKAA
ncbi:MAG: putative addiction module antidote protein [Rhodospirillaceae bacterium]|nr:putative addiction module antidote protein [Rhodospirillaceae bacterium]